MVSKNNKQLVRDNKARKDFSYQIAHVSLGFSLRTDVKEELKIFLDLMEAAKQDIGEELKKLGEK